MSQRYELSAKVIAATVGDERNHVPVEIADMEIRPAPRLFGRLLGEVQAALIEFLEQVVRVGDFDGGQDQRGLPRGEFGEVRLAHVAQVQAGGAPRHRTVERRRAIKEIDVEAQLLLKKRGARRYVSDEQNWDNRFKDYFAHRVLPVRVEAFCHKRSGRPIGGLGDALPA